MAFQVELIDGTDNGKHAKVSDVQALVTEETNLYIINQDVVNPSRTITGRALIGSKETDKVWQLKEVVTSGNITRTRLAGDGSFSFSWDDRLNQFEQSFNNSFSTNFQASDYANFGDIPQFDYEYTDEFSISGWIKASTGTSQRIICSKQEGTGNGLGWRLASQTQLRFHMSGGASGNRIEVRSATSTNTDTWLHFVVTKSNGLGASTVTMYINNALETPTLSSDTLSSTAIGAGNAQISGRNTTSSAFVGNIDELAFWDKVLSSDEVGNVYNSGSPGNLEDLSFFGNCTGWYRMGDNTSASFPTLVDETGNENATYTNMTADQIQEEVPG
jgi:hypothetical protein